MSPQRNFSSRSATFSIAFGLNFGRRIPCRHENFVISPQCGMLSNSSRQRKASFAPTNARSRVSFLSIAACAEASAFLLRVSPRGSASVRELSPANYCELRYPRITEASGIPGAAVRARSQRDVQHRGAFDRFGGSNCWTHSVTWPDSSALP